jgi:hypothetical protein
MLVNTAPGRGTQLPSLCSPFLCRSGDSRTQLPEVGRRNASITRPLSVTFGSLSAASHLGLQIGPCQPVLRFSTRPLERRGDRRNSLRPLAASSRFSAFASDLLVGRLHDVSAWRRGQVADDRRFEVDLGLQKAFLRTPRNDAMVRIRLLETDPHRAVGRAPIPARSQCGTVSPSSSPGSWFRLPAPTPQGLRRGSYATFPPPRAPTHPARDRSDHDGEWTQPPSGAAFHGARTGERGIDLSDVASMLGHKDVATTRRHYQGILASRLKQASDSLAGRFDGWKPTTKAVASKVDSLPAGPLSALPSAAAVH